MTIQEFVEKAIEGGWKPEFYQGQALQKIGDSYAPVLIRDIVLDPLAWQAYHRAISPGLQESTYAMAAEQDMVEMVRALNGRNPKTIEEYLETLT